MRYWSFNPLQIGSTLQKSSGVVGGRGGAGEVSIPHKSGQHFKMYRVSQQCGRAGPQFQSPTNRVNTSKTKGIYPQVNALCWFQSPTNRVNTSKTVLGRWRTTRCEHVSIPYKSGQHFKTARERVRAVRSRPCVSIPYKSGQHFKTTTVHRDDMNKKGDVSIPYKSGQHFKTSGERVSPRQASLVSIPYKSGQHFKSVSNSVLSRLINKVSIPYKSGQHFKTRVPAGQRTEVSDGFQSPTNRVNTSKTKFS